MYPRVKVRFKDGTEMESFQGSTLYEEKRMVSTYIFKMPIDVTQVEAIMINETEITVK